MQTIENQLGKKSLTLPSYQHQKLEPKRRFLRFLLRTIGIHGLIKLNRVEGVEHIPPEGPAILMINHIAFIDPIVVLHACPRNIVPLAKIEVYDYPVIGLLPRIWEVIPVRREEFDRRAIQLIQEVLRAGEIVLIAPEGTRNPSLQMGKEGVAYVASRNDAPIVPVAVEGTHGFPALRFSSAWRAPGAVVRFGRPFRYKAEYNHPKRTDLRKMTDEAMYVLSAMLPPSRRGVYSAIEQATQDTIEML